VTGNTGGESRITKSAPLATTSRMRWNASPASIFEGFGVLVPAGITQRCPSTSTGLITSSSRARPITRSVRPAELDNPKNRCNRGRRRSQSISTVRPPARANDRGQVARGRRLALAGNGARDLEHLHRVLDRHELDGGWGLTGRKSRRVEGVRRSCRWLCRFIDVRR
jgi:hypothetical protein